MSVVVKNLKRERDLNSESPLPLYPSLADIRARLAAVHDGTIKRFTSGMTRLSYLPTTSNVFARGELVVFNHDDDERGRPDPFYTVRT